MRPPMTVPVTVRYRCGREEHGRVTGPDVGKLPPNYTVHIDGPCPAWPGCAAWCTAQQQKGDASGGQVG